MQKISLFKKNILKYIDYKKISKSEFYRITGITRGVLDHETGLSEDNVTKFIVSFPEVNKEWLLTGKGEMLNIVREFEPKVSFEKVDSKKAKEYGFGGIPMFMAHPEQSQKGIPMLPYEALAGFGNDMEGVNFDIITERYHIPVFDSTNIDFMLKVHGDSMYPTFSNGDVVACTFIKELHFIQWQKIYVIDTSSQGIILKRLNPSKEEEHVLCVSDNENYPPFDMPRRVIRNIALVIGVIRFV